MADNNDIPQESSSRPQDEITAPQRDFPQTPDDFEDDPRVSFSKLDNRWILEDDDGSEWEWNETLSRWMPSLDEALLEQQREAYAVAGVDENAPVQLVKKRKKGQTDGENGTQKRAKGSKPERKNTAVYVTSLPLDTTIEEVASVFSKCGVIAEEIDSKAPRIKLYQDEQGNFKGDALVVYFRSESVQLAIQMLDETDFRFGVEGPTGKMRVKEADYSYKKQRDAPAQANVRQKKKALKKTTKLNNKLADWDDDDPSAIPDASARWEKVVILKHMFTLEELEEDPAAILEIKEDIREECSKLGEVTNVVLFDKEPEGVASVRFGNEEAAHACVRVMNGRHFGGQEVVACIASGTEKFKKSTKKKTTFGDEDDEAEENEESRRLDEFGQWLEREGGTTSTEANEEN